MTFIACEQVQGLVRLPLRRHVDARGSFMECWREEQLSQHLGRAVRLVQENQSESLQGVLRGLHYQLEQPQAKLLRVIDGQIQDVVVDLRRSSPTFGQHASVLLSSEHPEQLWIPEGCAHGFLVLSARAVLSYAVTSVYHPASEQVLRWDDPALSIPWMRVTPAPLLSAKDAAGMRWDEAPTFP